MALVYGEKTIEKSQKQAIKSKIKPKQHAFRSLHISGLLHVSIKKNSVNYLPPIYGERILCTRDVCCYVVKWLSRDITIPRQTCVIILLLLLLLLCVIVLRPDKQNNNNYITVCKRIKTKFLWGFLFLFYNGRYSERLISSFKKRS